MPKATVTTYTCNDCGQKVVYEDERSTGMPDRWIKVGSQYFCGAHRVIITYVRGDFDHVKVESLHGADDA